MIRYFNTTGITKIDHTAAFLSGLEGDALNVPTITLSNLELAPGVTEGVIRKAWLRANFIPKNVHLEAIPLENLDKIRDELLAKPGNQVFEVNSSTLKPFAILNSVNQESQSNNAMLTNQYGLVVKTYDSDVMQNWINTEWIDGENGINEISAVAVEDGKITMDSLNLAQKVYKN